MTEMSADLSGSLIGLSLMTGSNSFADFSASNSSAPAIETKAVRVAKAQFTTAPTTPPWKETPTTLPVSAQVSAIKAMTTIIDKPATGPAALPSDVQTSFTTYKALDRLRLLAETATATTSNAAQRATLQTTFAKGLTDLQGFLAHAPNGILDLSLAQPARSATSVGIPSPDAYTVKGPEVAASRSDPLPGMTGQEQLKITLSKPGASDTLTVDLSQGPQPPTLDSVSDALNAAISALPRLNPDGSLQLDDKGMQQPKWLAHFTPERGTDKWGLTLNAPNGADRVTIDQINAKPALLVATGESGPVALAPGQTAVAGQQTATTPTATQIFRFADPAGAMVQKSVATLSALDRVATEQAKIAGKTTSSTTTFKTDYNGKAVATTTKNTAVQANTDAAAMATDAQGNTYVVGTTRGDLGSERSNGSDTLFLTKLDGAGKVVWERGLGAAGASTGAAVSVAANGDVVVAGTVTGSLDGVTHDGDMFVARYSTLGDEAFTTVVPGTGNDVAKALAIGNDGSVFVGGKSATGGGDAFVARLDSTGHVADRSAIDSGGSESVTALAIGSDGNVLALVNNNGTAQLRKLDASALSNDLATLDLGTADARALAVGSDGTIAVGGSASAALAGTQVNGTSGGRDGFVARIDGALSGAAITYVGSAQDDQVDSVAFLDGAIYAGGRTSGTIGAARSGTVDGFVSRIDGATGAIASTTQFGQSGQTTQPVRLAVAATGDNSLGAIGFGTGTINPEVSAKLVTQTALRVGDSFSISIDGGTAKKITITADDTMQTLSDRIGKLTGTKGSTSTPRISGMKSLRIDAAAGHSIELIPGTGDRDALSKLGIAPQRIETPLPVAANAPTVRPGGAYGLDLSTSLTLATPEDAKAALGKIKSALSMTQTAYRSLYWDDTKASIVNNTKKAGGGTVSAYQQAQLAGYQSALARLSSSTSDTSNSGSLVSLFGG